MSQNLGDLNIKIILEILGAEKNAKKINATLTNTEEVIKKVKKQASDFSSGAVKLGFVLNTVKEVGYALNSSLSTIFNTIRSSNDAYQQFLSSNRQLEATSKLTGANLKDLNSVSEQTKKQFFLTAGQSNSFTIELTKLGQKAGDVSKVQQSINALMDLGAGQGLGAEQTLYAIKQAILGIDEGTDKLFQKNPSVLYDEYAKSIGTTAGKLTDQQKSQALLDAILKDGSILNGQYEKYLESAAGKQQILNGQIEEAKVKLGEQLQPVLLTFLEHVNNLIESYNSLDSSTKTLVIGVGIFSTALAKATPLIIAFKDSFGSLPTLIKGLSTEGSAGIKSFASNIALNLGKGSIATLAILAFATIVDDLISAIKDLIYWRDKAASIELNKTKHDYKPNANSDATDVPLQTDEKGNLRIMTQQEAEALGLLPKDIPDYGPEITPEQRKLLLKKEPKTKSPGSGKVISDVKEFVGYLTVLNKRLDEIKIKIDNQTEGESIAEGLFGTKKELEDRIEFINKLNSLGPSGFLKEKFQRDIESGINVPEKRFGGVLSDSDVNPFENENENKTTIKDKLDQGLSAAQNIASILGFGADNFVSKLIAGLNNGISLVSSIAKILSLFGSGGLTGIFSVLGLASGGMVPGSGSGDSVPAMLTPGEFVIKKSRAGQLGTRFLQWLNGGGSVQSMAPGAFASLGNTSHVIEVPYIVTHKVEGSDLRTILSRVDKTNNRRKL